MHLAQSHGGPSRGQAVASLICVNLTETRTLDSANHHKNSMRRFPPPYAIGRALGNRKSSPPFAGRGTLGYEGQGMISTLGTQNHD